jgi:hypothetical protein
MGLLARKEVDNLVYEIYITHLYKDKWVNSGIDLYRTLESGHSLLCEFKLSDNKVLIKESHPYATKCKVIIYNKDTSIPIIEVEDKVICHPKDKFSRKEGRRLSFNKVIDRICHTELSELRKHFKIAELRQIFK